MSHRITAMNTATLETLHSRRNELLAIARQHGATDMRVFGSVARGEDTVDSDVDFLVRMENGRSLLDMVALRRNLKQALARPVDVVSENGVFPYIRQRVLDEARPL
jgi:predicted nucleotidyltransferase